MHRRTKTGHRLWHICGLRGRCCWPCGHAQQERVLVLLQCTRNAIRHQKKFGVLFLMYASTVQKRRSAIKKVKLYTSQLDRKKKKTNRWSLGKVKCCSFSSNIISQCGQWSLHRDQRYRLHVVIRLLAVLVWPHCTNILKKITRLRAHACSAHFPPFYFLSL